MTALDLYASGWSAPSSVELDLYGLDPHGECEEFCVATHKPGVCVGTKRGAGTAVAPARVVVPAAPARDTRDLPADNQAQANLQRWIALAQQHADRLGAKGSGARQAAHDYGRALHQRQQVRAAVDKARAAQQGAHDKGVAAQGAANLAAQHAAAQAAVKAAHKKLVAHAKGARAAKAAAKRAQAARPLVFGALTVSDLYALGADADLYAVMSFEHAGCTWGEFCRNPLHPGPCKGWKHTLHAVAPGAYHAYEKSRVQKANERRLAKIKALQEAGKHVPASLLKEITYDPAKLKAPPSGYLPPTPSEAKKVLPATAKEIAAKIADKHANNPEHVANAAQQAYQDLLAQKNNGNGYIAVSDLRDHPLLKNLTKAQQDAGLLYLSKTNEHAAFVPESNQKVLPDKVREGALMMGNVPRHYLQIVDPSIQAKKDAAQKLANQIDTLHSLSPNSDKAVLANKLSVIMAQQGIKPGEDITQLSVVQNTIKHEAKVLAAKANPQANPAGLKAAADSLAKDLTDHLAAGKGGNPTLMKAALDLATTHAGEQTKLQGVIQQHSVIPSGDKLTLQGKLKTGMKALHDVMEHPSATPAQISAAKDLHAAHSAKLANEIMSIIEGGDKFPVAHPDALYAKDVVKHEDSTKLKLDALSAPGVTAAEVAKLSSGSKGAIHDFLKDAYFAPEISTATKAQDLMAKIFPNWKPQAEVPQVKANPDTMIAGKVAASKAWKPAEKMAALTQPEVTQAEFDKLPKDYQDAITSFLAGHYDESPAAVGEVAHKLGIDMMSVLLPNVKEAGSAPVPSLDGSPAHVQSAHQMATGAVHATLSKKLPAYNKLSQGDYLSLPADAQVKIHNDLTAMSNKFLDPKKLATVKAKLAEFGLPGEPISEGNPHQAGAGGAVTSSPHVMSAATKSEILSAFKLQPTGTQLKHTPESIYDNLVAVAAHFGKSGPAKGLTIRQAMKIIDETHSQNLGVANTSKLEEKITDWLQTAAGASYAKSHSTPNPEIMKSMGAGAIDVKLPAGQKVQKVAGPGSWSQVGKMKSGDFSRATIEKITADQKKYMDSTGQPWEPQQKAALHSYTTASGSINNYLRGVDSGAGSAKAAAINAQAGMRPLQSDVLLLRGTKWDALPPDARNVESVKTLVGKTISDPAFLSTSPAGSGGHFHDRPVQYEIEAPKGTMGAAVKHISEFAHENEVLLAAGTQLRVLSVKEDGFNRVIIRVRVVGTSTK